MTDKDKQIEKKIKRIVNIIDRDGVFLNECKIAVSKRFLNDKNYSNIEKDTLIEFIRQQARAETLKEVEKMIDKLIIIHPKISDENMAIISNLQILKQQLKNLEKNTFQSKSEQEKP